MRHKSSLAWFSEEVEKEDVILRGRLEASSWNKAFDSYFIKYLYLYLSDSLLLTFYLSVMGQGSIPVSDQNP